MRAATLSIDVLPSCERKGKHSSTARPPAAPAPTLGVLHLGLEAPARPSKVRRHAADATPQALRVVDSHPGTVRPGEHQPIVDCTKSVMFTY